MKKLLFILAAVVITASVMAEGEYPQYRSVNHYSDSSVRYKLYQTFNLWTFLKLDTRRGTIYQVQYSKKEGQSFETYLGTPGIYGFASDTINGRYELYPTQNNWTFLLVDQIDGDVYEVQWSQESDKYRYIKRIP